MHFFHSFQQNRDGLYVPKFGYSTFVIFRFALCQAYIEHGKFLPLDEEFANDEKALEKQKAEKNAARLKKETAAVMNAERKRRTRERYLIFLSISLLRLIACQMMVKFH